VFCFVVCGFKRGGGGGTAAPNARVTLSADACGVSSGEDPRDELALVGALPGHDGAEGASAEMPRGLVSSIEV
jgi:hypothetical protein